MSLSWSNVRNGRAHVVRWLLWNSAPDMPALERSTSGALALHYASARGCLDCVKLLVETSLELSPHIENSIVRFTTMLTEPILSHESEYPFPVVPTVLKLAGQGTSDSADSRARLVLYEPAHSGSITHLVDTIDRHHIDFSFCLSLVVVVAGSATTAVVTDPAPQCIRTYKENTRMSSSPFLNGVYKLINRFRQLVSKSLK
ncbi:hypothetical protein M8J77_009374 [Diaphorina citri]|nr:hypothetical protein M8J77_009374 [Diaphorina citri]